MSKENPASRLLQFQRWRNWMGGRIPDPDQLLGFPSVVFLSVHQRFGRMQVLLGEMLKQMCPVTMLRRSPAVGSSSASKAGLCR